MDSEPLFGRLSMQRRWNGTDAEKYRKQAIEAAETARDAAERAADAASKAARTAMEWAEPRVKTAKEWAVPRVESTWAEAKEWAVPRVESTWAEAKEWATPRAEHAVHTAARKATPYVKKAGSKAEHWVEVAQGAIVGAAIPAVISAFDRAAEEDRDPAPRKGGSTLAKVLIPVLIAGAAGAALVMWAKRNPAKDGWAGDDDEWEFEGEEDFAARLRRDVNKAADATAAAARRAAEAVTSAASVVAEQAGPYVNKAKEQATPYVDKARAQATPYVDKAVVAASTAAARAKDAAAPVVERAKEVAGPVVEKAKATASGEAERLRANVEAARHRAAVGLAEALDDVEDVWEDEGGTPDDAPAPAKKARAPRNPASKKTDE